MRLARPRRLSSAPIHPRPEQHPAVVDPDRPRHLGKLKVLVAERVEGQFAAGLHVLPVEPPRQRHFAADVFQRQAAALEAALLQAAAARPTASAAARPAGRTAPGRSCRGDSSRRWDSVRPPPFQPFGQGLDQGRGRRGADRPTSSSKCIGPASVGLEIAGAFRGDFDRSVLGLAVLEGRRARRDRASTP